MSDYLNPGNEYYRIRLNNKFYVDKTGLIEETNKRIFADDWRYVCVTRPRRSGKSTAAEMLAAYYDRGCDSKEMFKDFEIAKCADFEEHLNRYNVIRLDMNDFISSGKNMSEVIKAIRADVAFDLKEAYPDICANDDYLPDLFYEIYDRTDVPFVFIIDEWDCFARDDVLGNDDAGQIEYLRFLDEILKGRIYVALCYMTGILPILKTMDGGLMDMFDEISMTRPGRFARYMGFTEDEVKNLCERYNRSYEEIEGYYKGYNVDGLTVYNPVDIDKCIYYNKKEPYWANTEYYHILEQYFKIDGVKEAVEKMFVGEKVSVETGRFDNSMTKLRDRDDVLTLLVHLGYLTYEYTGFEELVWIPNEEIREQFATILNAM